MKATIYTDGSSRGNPGPGGWGLIYMDDDAVKEKGGRENATTNNRMEMKALIEGLLDLNDTVTELVVCADSQYVLKGISEWMVNWKKNNWKTSTKKPVLNQDLWQEIDALVSELTVRNVRIEWKHVRGHAGIELNERADVIATTFADDTPTELYIGVKDNYRAFLKTLE